MHLLRTSVNLLNHPSIKEGIKTFAGTFTFSFGIIEVYDIYRAAFHPDTIKDVPSRNSQWRQTANKIIIVCARLSLILSAAVSRPGIWLISSLLEWVFTPIQLNRAFGPYTTFANNPWHPRHLLSIAAVIMALPSTFPSQIIYTSPHLSPQTASIIASQSRDQGSDSYIPCMTTFNTVTSRPILHLANNLLTRI